MKKYSIFDLDTNETVLNLSKEEFLEELFDKFELKLFDNYLANQDLNSFTLETDELVNYLSDYVEEEFDFDIILLESFENEIGEIFVENLIEDLLELIYPIESKNGKYLLIEFFDNEIQGFWLTTEKEYNILKPNNIEKPIEIYFGTNEFIIIENIEDFNNSLAINEISLSTYNELTSILGEEFGLISISNIMKKINGIND